MEKTLNTLIIHPQDRSTDFLSPIYESIKDKLVVRTGFGDKERIQHLLREFSRIMMMGHGSPQGLFNVTPGETGFVIDSFSVPELRKRTNNVMIWCYADQFVQQHDLKGFYTAMHISEVIEANYCGVKNVSQKDIDESNECFSRVLGRYINEPGEITFQKLMNSEYKILAENNPVAFYNYQRLYLK